MRIWSRGFPFMKASSEDYPIFVKTIILQTKIKRKGDAFLHPLSRFVAVNVTLLRPLLQFQQ